MNNEKGGQNPGQKQNPPTDKGEDAEDRREAAERAWKDRAGVPRGTPEQGEQRRTPDIDEQSNESRTKESTTKKDV